MIIDINNGLYINKQLIDYLFIIKFCYYDNSRISANGSS